MLLLSLILAVHRPTPSTILDVAPSPVFTDVLRADHPSSYTSLDRDPEVDGRTVDIRADVTRLPLADDSVGFLLCSHILEHVRDDAEAIAELARVVHPGGTILLQVPRRRGVDTEEAPDASPGELLDRFGQADHVRLYGDDFEARLEGGGLVVAPSFSYRQVLPMSVLELIGVASNHELWIAATSVEAIPLINEAMVVRALARRMLSSTTVPDLRGRLDTALTEAETWRQHYEWLSNRPVVRIGRRISHGMRRKMP